MTDKDAMEKAASDFEDKVDRAHGRHFDCCYNGSDIENAFEAGWRAAHQGPKVLALVEALRQIGQFHSHDISLQFIFDTARKALAEFEGEM